MMNTLLFCNFYCITIIISNHLEQNNSRDGGTWVSAGVVNSLAADSWADSQWHHLLTIILLYHMTSYSNGPGRL